jgi:GntR family transcriptional repressor for pyruvate dehydrogenase complex
LSLNGRLKRVNLVHAVVDSLREEILNGVVAPGATLPAEGELCQTFGVSRTVIREAMRTLRAQGLVEVSQGKRPRVKPADAQATVEAMLAYMKRGAPPLKYLMEFRWALATQIIRLAALRGTEEHFTALEAVIHQQQKACDLEDANRLDNQFHALLAAASGNPLYEIFFKIFGSLMRSPQFAIIRTLEAGQAAAVEHQEILQALRDCDPERAEQLMVNHLRGSARDLGLEFTPGAIWAEPAAKE